LKDLWAYKESETEVVRDETIEAGSEVAQKAREAARAKAAQLADMVSSAVEDVQGDKSDEDGANVDDDSWMEGGVAGNGQDGKARKRRTKKK
jgi:minor histocompatibility antigen H13